MRQANVRRTFGMRRTSHFVGIVSPQLLVFLPFSLPQPPHFVGIVPHFGWLDETWTRPLCYIWSMNTRNDSENISFAPIHRASFILTLWAECQPDGGLIWRGYIETSGGERDYFSSVNDLATRLESLCSSRANEKETTQS